MKASQTMDITQIDVPWIASLLGVGSDANDFSVGFNALIITVILLTILVFKLGFAKQLTWWKSLVVYMLLALGAGTMALVFFTWPIPEVLLVMAVVLAIYRGRLWWNRRQGIESH
ncbi:MULTISPECIES: YlaH-like family protein [Exiguobacterium]|nr:MULTISPECIES: YlaH-like family protein [Exiguobacterium]MCT4777903.1 YlaH-like family protein [Exiguobacterium aquaticum]MCT4790535.1 YlaH-like family protein [Exiguobacterium mexicanum]MDL5375749.1 YlaH-like family protein [Exiguobacterium mexicanum]UTT41909.1 YlaH-like family protein [Exiguobacterium aurantiacum]